MTAVGALAALPLMSPSHALVRATSRAAHLHGTLAGAISWRVDAGSLDLHRLAVDPNHSALAIRHRFL